MRNRSSGFLPTQPHRSVFFANVTYLRQYGRLQLEVATASALELAFEHLLRASGVHDSVFWALRINDITDRATLCDLNSSEGFKVSPRDLRIDVRPAREDPGGLAPKREMLRLITAWKEARVHFEAKLHTEATAEAHGVPTTMLACDWLSIIEAYKKKHGVKLCPKILQV